MFKGSRSWMCLAFLAVGVFLVWPSSSFATDYYVSPTGSDANDGLTEQSPWREIQTALNAATSPGDTIYVMPGVNVCTEFYTDPDKKRLRFQGSGTDGNPITMTTLPGASQKATIDLRNVSPGWWGFTTNSYNYTTVDGQGDPDILDRDSFLLEISNVPVFGDTTW